MFLKIKSETRTLENGDVLMDVTIIQDDGSQVSKSGIALEDYLTLFEKNALKKAKQLVPIGPLPDGYINGYLGEPEDFDVAFFVPAAKRGVLYGGMHFYVPFPNLVFTFSVRSGLMIYGNCFATNELSDKGLAYYYPFGNVSYDGRICFGNIKRQKCTCLKDTEMYVEQFFQSETNNDYFDSSKVSINVTQGKLLEKLSKKDTFPVRWLSCCKNGEKTYTVKKYLEKIQGKRY